MTITVESVAEIALRRIMDARHGVSELQCFSSSDKRPVEMALEVAQEMLALIVAQPIKRIEVGVDSRSLGDILADELISPAVPVEMHDDFVTQNGGEQ